MSQQDIKKAVIYATKLEAIELPLSDGGVCTLVQDGAEWNRLVKFKCVAPDRHLGAVLITCPDDGANAFSSSFANILHGVFGGSQRAVVVMGTPALFDDLAKGQA